MLITVPPVVMLPAATDNCHAAPPLTTVCVAMLNVPEYEVEDELAVAALSCAVVA